MADADGPSEEELLREESTPGPTYTGSIFAALLQEMRKMNENILAITEPTEPSEESPERENNDSESLDERVANLTASGSTEPNVLADIARDLDASEKTGPAVSEGLAGIVNSLLKEKLPDEKIQSKIDLYPKPQNVTGLRTPCVNHLIWNQISPTSRTNDSRTQKSQNALLAGVVAMIKATDLVLDSELKDNKDLVKFMTDAIALTLQGHHDLNTARRQAMKNDLNKDYAALCSSSPVDQTYEYLFGDLSKLAKDITDANRLTKKVRPSAPQASHSRDRSNRLGGRKIYGHHNNNRYAPYQGRNDFLSKGHPPRGRKKEGTTNKQ